MFPLLSLAAPSCGLAGMGEYECALVYVCVCPPMLSPPLSHFIDLTLSNSLSLSQSDI